MRSLVYLGTCTDIPLSACKSQKEYDVLLTCSGGLQIGSCPGGTGMGVSLMSFPRFLCAHSCSLGWLGSWGRGGLQ